MSLFDDNRETLRSWIGAHVVVRPPFGAVLHGKLVDVMVVDIILNIEGKSRRMYYGDIDSIEVVAE